MKSLLTKEIEKHLCIKANRECKRFALEVSVPYGICDFITVAFGSTIHNLPYISCYEIKISFSDFKSKNGHNFVGDCNYYVVPEKLYEEKIKNKVYLRGIGLIVYRNGKFYEKVHSVDIAKAVSLDRKLRIVDTILMRWTSGGMYKDLQHMGCDLRNWTAQKELTR